MIVAVHALTGAALSRLCRTPAQAFALGFASHLVGDMLPHRDLDLPEEALLLGAALGLVAAARGPGSNEFAGALGAAVPDIENLVGRLRGIPDERLLLPTHRRHHGPRTRGFAGQLALAALSLALVCGSSSSG